MIDAKFAAISIANFCFFMSVNMTSALLPLYLSERNVSESLNGFIFGVAAIGALGARLFSGRAVDQRGTKAFLLIGSILWVITSPLIPLSSSHFFVMIVIRILQGIGLAFFMNASFGFIMYTTTKENRAKATSWFGIANNLAAALGPLLATFLLTQTSFFSSFFLGSLIAFTATVICLLLPQTKISKDEVVPKESFIFAIKAIFPGFLGSSLALSLGSFMIIAPLRAQELEFEQAGILLTLYAVSMIFVKLSLAPLSDKKGRAWAIIPGLGFTILSFIILSLSHDPFIVLIGPICLGIGAGLGIPGSIAWSVDRSAETEHANAVSTFYTVYEVGLFLGSSVIGLVVQTAGWQGMLLISFITSTCLVCYLYLIFSKNKERTVEK